MGMRDDDSREVHVIREAKLVSISLISEDQLLADWQRITIVPAEEDEA